MNKSIFVLIISIFANLWINKANSDVHYTFGIGESIYPDTTICDGLNINKTVNITCSCEIIHINELSNFSLIQNESRKLSNKSIDYLIYPYSRTATIISNILKIPYFIPYSIPFDSISTSSNIFYIESLEQLISNAAQALLIKLKANSIIYIDDVNNPTSKNLIAFNTFRQTLIQFNISSSVFIDSVVLNSDNFYLVSIPLSNQVEIEKLFSQALRIGQLNPGKVILLNTLVINESLFSIFEKYSQVAADIYGFTISANSSIPNLLTNTTLLRTVLVKEFVRLAIDTVKTSLSVKLSNSTIQLLSNSTIKGDLITQQFGFVPTGTGPSKLVGINVIIKKVNTSPNPIDRYNYSTQLVDVNAANIIASLNDSLIRIAVTPSLAYFMEKPKTSITPASYHGFSVGLLEALQTLSTFKYEFVFPTDDNVTGEVFNVTDTGVTQHRGVIRLLMENKADISIIPMVTSNMNSINELFLSDTILVMRLSMLTRQPDLETTFVTVLYPFSYNVWLSILGMFIIMGFGYWVVDTIGQIFPINKTGSQPDKDKPISETGETSFLVVYSSFVMAKLKIKPRLPSAQLFAFVMWFSTLTLIITYASNLLPFLMQPNGVFQFTRLVDLFNYQKHNFKWLFVKDSIDVELLKQDSTISGLLNISLKEWSQDAFISDINATDVLNKNRFILIENDKKIGYIFNNNCTSVVFSASDTLYSLKLVMRRQWRQYPEMQGLLSKLAELGTINSLGSLYFSSGKCARAQDSITPSPQVLELSRIVGLFIIPVIGIISGLLYVLCVLIRSKIKRFKELNTREKFEYGQNYRGVIHSLENDGAWVYINNRSRPYFIHSSSLNPDLKKVKSPFELGLCQGDEISLKYFGKDPIKGDKRFCKDFDNKNTSYV